MIPKTAKPGADREGRLESLGQRAGLRGGVVRPAASTCAVRVVATVERMARPSAPPTCWAVLMSPEASPASCSLTPGHGDDHQRHERRSPRPSATITEGASTSAYDAVRPRPA